MLGGAWGVSGCLGGVRVLGGAWRCLEVLGGAWGVSGCLEVLGGCQARPTRPRVKIIFPSATR